MGEVVKFPSGASRASVVSRVPVVPSSVSKKVCNYRDLRNAIDDLFIYYHKYSAREKQARQANILLGVLSFKRRAKQGDKKAQLVIDKYLPEQLNGIQKYKLTNR